MYSAMSRRVQVDSPPNRCASSAPDPRDAQRLPTRVPRSSRLLNDGDQSMVFSPAAESQYDSVVQMRCKIRMGPSATMTWTPEATVSPVSGSTTSGPCRFFTLSNTIPTHTADCPASPTNSIFTHHPRRSTLGICSGSGSHGCLSHPYRRRNTAKSRLSAAECTRNRMASVAGSCTQSSAQSWRKYTAVT